MAYISVNPDRRDPGHFRRKAEIGLSNVDNISASEFINAVSEDIKIINNKKKKSSKISSIGEFYGGLLKTAEFNSHVSFTLGLFNTFGADPNKELASVYVDFSFSGRSKNEYGSINYTVKCPDNDEYLKSLSLVFHQVDGFVYVSLYSKKLPLRGESNYFNQVGVNFIEWTEGITKLDGGKNISKQLISGVKLSEVLLDESKTTTGITAATSLAIYDKETLTKLTDTNLSESQLENIDFPTINGIPFTGGDLTVDGKPFGRNIEISAYHSSSDRDGSGIHDWEVLGNLKRINLTLSGDKSKLEVSNASDIPNSGNSLEYGLVRPSKYKKMTVASSGTSAIENAASWLNSLGEDTDVITVGAFKEYMSYLLHAFSGEDVESYKLSLTNSTDLYKYFDSFSDNGELEIYSYLETISGEEITKTPKTINVVSSADWIHVGTVSLSEDRYTVPFSIDANQGGSDRVGKIIITQVVSGNVLEVYVIQKEFIVNYGFLLKTSSSDPGVPIYESTSNILSTWGRNRFSQTLYLTPIKSSNLTSTNGYEEITPSNLILTNLTSWVNSELKQENTGVNVYTLKLSGEPNSFNFVRSGTLYISLYLEGEESPYIIPIACSQEKVSPELIIDGNSTDSICSYSVGKNEVTKSIKIDSNYSWEVSDSVLPTWISLSGYTGKRPSGISYLTVVISENNSQNSREASIHLVNSGGIEKTIKIVQSPRTVYIDINRQSEDQYFSFPRKSKFETIELTVDSNVNWFIDYCPSWIEPSKYDGGETGKETHIPLRLTINDDDEGSDSTTPSTVSLAYYDESDSTIYSLRKITVVPKIDTFVDSVNYVCPQSPLTIEIPSSGGSHTISCLANTRYRMFYIDEFLSGKSGPNTSMYFDMLVGYESGEYNIFSESAPSEDDLDQPTNLTFEVSKNTLPYKREFLFCLIPAPTDEFDSSIIDENEYPWFKVIQGGSKKVESVFYKDSSVKNYNTNSISSVFINGFYGGITTNTSSSSTYITKKTYSVHECFQASRGDIIIPGEGSPNYLYMSETQIPGVGDSLRRIWYEGFYVVKNDGWYTTTNGKAQVITPEGNEYSTDFGETKFNLLLLSSKINSWDLVNETVPGWISLEKISGNNYVEKIEVSLSENSSYRERSFALQFFVDRSYQSITTFQITQSGVNVGIVERSLDSVHPVVSGKTFYSGLPFQVGLSALATYKIKYNVHGEIKEFTSTEYVYVDKDKFSVSAGNGASLELDDFGKPCLCVSENNSSNKRSIVVTVNYKDKSGTLEIIQAPGLSNLFYQTFSDLSIELDSSEIPLGIDTIGFKVKGTVHRYEVSFDPSTGSAVQEVGIAHQNQTIRFTSLLNAPELSGTGFSMKVPGSLRREFGSIGNLVLKIPHTKYEFDGNNLTEKTEYDEIPFEIQDLQTRSIVPDYSVLSGNVTGKTLISNISLINTPSVTVFKSDSSGDTGRFMKENQSIGVSGNNYTNDFSLSVGITGILSDYSRDRYISYVISPTGSSNSKYVHFRNLGKSPIIECKGIDSNYYVDSGEIESTAKIVSNIGYETSLWSNYTNDLSIDNGSLETSNAFLSSQRSIRVSHSYGERLWYPRYSPESIILKDSDEFGCKLETPIILDAGVGSSNKIQVRIGDKVLDASKDEYKIIFQNKLEKTTRQINILSYDGFEISTDNVFPKYSLEDGRSSIQKKIGSLSEVGLTINHSHEVVEGSGCTDRGIISLVNNSNSKKIGLYTVPNDLSKLAPKLENPSSGIIVLDHSEKTYEFKLKFKHSFTNWTIISDKTNLTGTIDYPYINNNNHYGSNGGSSSNLSKATEVSIKFPFYLLDWTNTSLEMKGRPLGLHGYSCPDTFYISSTPIGKYDDYPEEILSQKTPVYAYFRPKSPEFKICSDTEGTEVAGSLRITNLQSAGGNNKYTGEIVVYVKTDLMSRTEPYIGGEITMNGEKKNITDTTSVLSELCTVVLTSTPGHEKTKGICSEVIGEYAKYVFNVNITLKKDTYGYYTVEDFQLDISMADFVVNEEYYDAKSTSSKSISIVKKGYSIYNNI